MTARREEAEEEARLAEHLAKAKAGIPKSGNVAANKDGKDMCDQAANVLVQCFAAHSPSECAQTIDDFEACIRAHKAN